MHLNKDKQGEGYVRSVVETPEEGRNRPLRIRKAFELGSNQ